MIRKLPIFANYLLLSLVALTFPTKVKAQYLDDCQPPRPNQYLLLIISDSPDRQAKVRRILPPDVKSNVCRYVNNVVTRVSGFNDPDIANDWAKYMQEIAGLPAYVISGNNSAPPPIEPVPPDQPSLPDLPNNIGGYTVLVDYFNQPEIATRLQRELGRNVGVASYGQRLFLLVVSTPDPNMATQTVKNLSDRGFWPLLVDTRRVVVINPQSSQF